jgi:Fe-S cluster assembly iron-binding protein IscA
MNHDGLPVELTERTAKKIRDIIRSDPSLPASAFVRVYVREGGRLGLRLDESVDRSRDLVGQSQGLNVVVARSDQERLAGYVVDFQSQGPKVGFLFLPPLEVEAVSLGMIIQLPLTGRWGTEDEIQARDELAEALEDLLEREGLGEFSGTDVGSGSANLFIDGINAAEWEQAVQVVLDELKRRRLGERALIVKSLPEGQEEGGSGWVVVWPKDYRGRFRLF